MSNESLKDFRENYIKNYLQDFKKLIDEMENEFLTKISSFSEILHTARDNKKTIFIMGNGGSASTSSHFVTDLSKGTIVDDSSKRFKVISLTDNIPNIMSWSNDANYECIFVEQLKNLMSDGDIVIGISGSGNSPNVINAIDYANNNNAITIGFSGYDGGKLKQKVQHSIHVASFHMQKVEDFHLLIEHILTCLIREEDFSYKK